MERFDEKAAGWDDEPRLERSRRVARLLRSVLPLKGTERVLDVGAGTGMLSINLADAVREVLVSDASAGMVEVAGRNIEAAGLADRFEAAQLDLTKDDDALEPATFDGAWSMLALHHVTALDILLARVHNALRPGGWLAIVDLDSDPDGAFHAHVGPDFEGHHGFDRHVLAARLTKLGFTHITFTDAGAVDRELDGHDGQQHSFPLFLATATRS